MSENLNVNPGGRRDAEPGHPPRAGNTGGRPGPARLGDGPGRAQAARTPRWVKVFGIVTGLAVLLLLALLLLGGGEHGPGRHAPPDGPVGHAASVSGEA